MQPARPFTVLIADDASVIRQLVRSFLEGEGYTVCSANDGDQAVEVAALFHPDLVLLDRHMPGPESIEVIRRLKEQHPDQWIPLIMVSADDTQESQVEALENGADDYITKPINFKILAAKIRVFLHHVSLQNLLEAQRGELQQYRDNSERELLVTADLMQRLMRADRLGDARVHHWLSPAENFSGDLVAADRSHSGDLYGLLADATGHGLPAAINLIPLTQTFYAMVHKGFRIATIAEQMNRQLRQYTPPERFVAVTLLLINQRERRVDVFNAGNPPVLLLDGSGKVVHRVDSRCLPLGILDGGNMNFDGERLSYPEGAQVVLYSDGLTEAANAAGVAFGVERLESALGDGTASDRVASVQRALAGHTAGMPAHDDVSLLVFDCDQVDAAQAGNTDLEKPARALWRATATLSAEQLRDSDLVPMMVEWTRTMGLPAPQQSIFFVVMTELYNNALDHGLLGLDSGLKEAPDGYERYIGERAQRLENLQRGRISIALRHEHSAAGNRFRVRIKDSGAGFDPEPWLRPADPNLNRLSGRGIALVRSLCNRLEYFGIGNEVLAEIAY